MVAALLEWRSESAWITVLQAAPGLAGVPIRREYDASQEPVYPCVTVSARDASDEEWANRSDYSKVTVDITAWTYTESDKTGQRVAELLGKIREVVYGATILTQLSTAQANYTVNGCDLQEPAMREDTRDIRRRTLPVLCHAQCQDIVDNSSSSVTISST